MNLQDLVTCRVLCCSADESALAAGDSNCTVTCDNDLSSQQNSMELAQSSDQRALFEFLKMAQLS